MTTFDTDVLAELIRHKRERLVELREMGRRQLELINQEDVTALLDLLAAKQRTLIKLQEIERALDPFRDQDPQRRRWRTPEDRDACAREVRDCEALLGEIVRREKCSEDALVRRRDEAADRLQGVHLAGEARGAYTAQAPGKTNQLDLLSET